MKHYIEPCRCSEELKEKVCYSPNGHRLIFYYNLNFVIYEYCFHCRVYKGWSDFELVQYFCNQIGNGLSKTKQLYETKRSYRLDKELRIERVQGIKFKRNIIDINYIYSNAAGIEFCVTTKRKFQTNAHSEDEFYDEAQKTISYLAENGMEDLIEQVINLRIWNFREYPKLNDIIKYTDNIVKTLRKEIKLN